MECSNRKPKRPDRIRTNCKISASIEGLGQIIIGVIKVLYRVDPRREREKEKEGVEICTDNCNKDDHDRFPIASLN